MSDHRHPAGNIGLRQFSVPLLELEAVTIKQRLFVYTCNQPLTAMVF
jgi:hypothetical protein